MCVIKNVEPFIFAIDVEVLERTSSLPSGNYGKKKKQSLKKPSSQ